MITPRSGKLGRLIPIAASVPSTVAIAVALKPITKLLKIAIRHSGDWRMKSYQRSVRPVSG